MLPCFMFVVYEGSWFINIAWFIRIAWCMVSAAQ